jgi:hypothetical protein
MLLYKIINNMSDTSSLRKTNSKPKVIRELKKADEEFRRTILLKEQQNLSKSRSFIK